MRDLKHEFPLTEKCNYLNTAGVGLTPRSVLEDVSDFENKRLRIPPYRTLFEKWLVMVEDARREFGKLINAPSETISFQPNTSYSMNTLIEMLNWEKGDNVVLDDLHFPSAVYPLRRLENRGVALRWLKSKAGRVDVSQYEDAIDSHTKLVTVSYVSWFNGFRSQVEKIGRLARERGAYFVVDATHGAGYLDIDVQKWGCDFMMSSNYKWLLANFGAAEFYCRKELLDRFESPHVGWFSTSDRDQGLSLTTYNEARSARKFEPGNPAYTSIYSLTRTLEFLRKVGLSQVRERTLDLVQLLMNGLMRVGATIHTPAKREEHSGLVFCSFKGYTGPQISEFLRRRKIFVSARMFNGVSGIRISPYFYNTEEDIQELAEAVSRFVSQSRRGNPAEGRAV